MHRRTFTTVALLASVVCSTAPVLTGTATAEAATRPLLVTATDTDGDGGHGLYATELSSTDGARTPLVAESDTSDVYALSVSRDGSRIAYLQDLYSSTGDLTAERLVVRDTTLVGTPVLSRVVYTTVDGALDAPRLSPDGSTVLFDKFTFTDTGASVTELVAPVASGTATTLADGLSGAAYLDAATVIGTTASGVVTLPAAGGATTPVAGLTSDDGMFAASPDGTKLAWLHDTSTADTFTADVHVADLALSEGTATLSGDRTLLAGQDTDAPTWFPNSTRVVYVLYDADGNGSLRSTPQEGGSTPYLVVGAPAGDTVGVGYVSVDDAAPGRAALQPATLAGTSATIRWTLPADADLWGIELSRSSASPGTGKTIRIAAPATSYRDTGLVVGDTYDYYAVAIDRSGNRSETWTSRLTPLAATATFPDPTSTSYYTSPAFRVYFPGTGTRTVQVRTNGTGALTTWLDHASGTSHVYSAAKAGSSYGFVVTAYDGYGNATVPTGVGTAVVPYDQTRATFSGSVAAQSLSGRYLGSAELLKSAGAAARLVVNGNRLQVIGEKCTSCGVMDVYVDGVRVAGVDTHDTQRRSRVVLYTRNLTAGVNHAVVIKARGTAGHPTVVLDGFGVRH